jgi:hypothetical protein
MDGSTELAKRVKKSQKMMQEVNAAKVADQAVRRQRLFRSRAEELEAQKAETLAHLDDVDRRLREKQKLVEDRIERQKKEAVVRQKEPNPNNLELVQERT